MSTPKSSEIRMSLGAFFAAAGQSPQVLNSANNNPISLLQITPTKCISKRNGVAPTGMPSQVPAARKKLWQNDGSVANPKPLVGLPKAGSPKIPTLATVQCSTISVSSGKQAQGPKQTQNAGKNVRNIPVVKQQGSNSAPVFGFFDYNAMQASIYGTPPRNNSAAIVQQQHHLRRQNSASASIVIGAGDKGGHLVRGRSVTAFARYTPPSVFVKEDHGISSMYAGPKFIESPSAKSVPLPPTQWLEELRRAKADKVVVSDTIEEEYNANEDVAANAVNGTEEASSSAEESGAMSSEEVAFSGGKWSPSTVSSGRGDKTGDDSDKISLEGSIVSGIRLHPLQLIAAVATM